LTEPVDVSVVVPSHNGAALLPRTLSHIAAQRPPSELRWEVIVIDNGSTDGTSAVALASWPRDAPVGIRVVNEPELGLSHAHLRGFGEAKGELVSWVEDDNWISPEWLGLVWQTMKRNPEVGACGGFNEPVCEGGEPPWFEAFQSAYATGAQGGRSGYVTDDPGYLWGAGMTVRRDAWRHLVDNGFSPLLLDRQGRANFNSGGDVEISFALRLSGFRLWFEPTLRLRHHLLAHRLEWSYLRRFMRGFGAASVGLDPYRRALAGPAAAQQDSSWMAQARTLIGLLHRERRMLWEMSRRPREGDAAVMRLEFAVGRLRELLRRRRSYDQSFSRIENAAWRRR
jgi:glycosyltransferase involved in cell wall biosynthesis